jgi:uncharacterized protein DUF6496
VREEIHHIREGKHGARSTKQAIAIGLSKARRAGVKLKPQGKAKTTTKASRKAPSRRRSRAVRGALEREPRSTASHAALAKHARQSARQRTAADRRAAARKAARTRARRSA